MSSYKVDDLEAGIHHLNDLLDVICDIQFEVATGTTDRRIDSLLWLARDLSEGIVHRLIAEGEAKRGRAAA
jgi:hypothetical protein